MKIVELELILKAAKEAGMTDVDFYRQDSRSQVVLDVPDAEDISDNPVLYQNGDTLQIPLADCN